MTYRTFRPERVAGLLLALMCAATAVRAADSVLYRLFLTSFRVFILPIFIVCSFGVLLFFVG